MARVHTRSVRGGEVAYDQPDRAIVVQSEAQSAYVAHARPVHLSTVSAPVSGCVGGRPACAVKTSRLDLQDRSRHFLDRSRGSLSGTFANKVKHLWCRAGRGEVLHVLRKDGMRAGADGGRQNVAVILVVGH
jgi:hypothetical protein